MDDPWVSPWAEEPAEQLPATKHPTRQGLVKPTLPHLDEGNGSPWDDGEGFGEWAALPNTDDVGVTIPNGAEEILAGQWTALPNTQSIRETRDDGLHVPPGWLAQDSQSSGQMRKGLAVLKSRGDKISPELWGKENLHSVESTESQTCGVDRTVLDEDQTLNGDVQAEIDSHGTCNSTSNQTEQGKRPLTTVEVLKSSVNISRSSVAQNDSKVKLRHKTALSFNNRLPTQGPAQASRPSSSPCDRRPYEATFTESSDTFIEETEIRPKIETTQPQRDDDNSDSHGLNSAQASSSLKGSRGDTGRQADHEVEAFKVRSSSGTDIHPSSSSKSSLQKLGVNRLEGGTKSAKVQGHPRRSVLKEDIKINGGVRPSKGFTSVTFDFDLSLVAKLFAQTPDIPANSADRIRDMTDVESVIQNNFHSTEQRKVWYRISRYGTMREHNVGDEDNYVRANWKNSEVRVQCLKIVARWIEEDRAGSGISIGGSGSSGSLFGWGQKHTAPTSIAEVLATNRGRIISSPEPTIHQTKLLISGESGLSDQALEQNSINRTLPSNRLSESTSPLVAPQFSWSTGMPSSTATMVAESNSASSQLASPPQHLISSAPGTYSEGQVPLDIRIIEEHPPLSTSTLFQHPNVVEDKTQNDLWTSLASEVPATADAEADEDWGEMATASSIASVQQPSSVQIREQSEAFAQASSPAAELIPLPVSPYIPVIPRTSKSISKVNNTTLPPPSPKSNSASFLEFSPLGGSSRSVKASPPIISQAIANKTTALPHTLTTNNKVLSEEEELEHDGIVKSIVQKLPDLSYMLRR